MTTTPKTIDLPPEPPIGTKWLDHDGHQWRHEPEGWALQGGTIRHAWFAVCRYLPLTLIEPDPWPTHELIVADWIAGAAKGHGLLYLDGHEYVTIESGHVLREGRDTLTNVVPVTVIPVAALPVLWSALEQWLNGNSDPDSDTNRLIGAVINLREQIDALGVDL